MIAKIASTLGVREETVSHFFRISFMALLAFGIVFLRAECAFADGSDELEDALGNAQSGVTKILGKGILIAALAMVGIGILCQVLPFQSLKRHATQVWMTLGGLFVGYVLFSFFGDSIRNAMKFFTVDWAKNFGLG